MSMSPWSEETVQRRPVATHRRLAETEALPRWDYVASGERLSAADERDLSALAQAGDGKARERMICANIPLVVSVARQYRTSRLDMEDLIQEGMIGLCTAVERYEPERGFRFSTYATYWIKQRILRALDRQGRLIRFPVDVACAARKVHAVREELSCRLGREPTLAETASECGVSEKRLKAVLESLDEPLSLDGPLGDDADAPTLDVADDAPNPETRLLQDEEHGLLEELLASLPSRDRMVLEGRFGLGGPVVSLADLSARLCISSEGVRQIQRRALLKLRRRLEQTPAVWQALAA